MNESLVQSLVLCLAFIVCLTVVWFHYDALEHIEAYAMSATMPIPMPMPYLRLFLKILQQVRV